jgi:hypothetical protein
VPHSAALEVGDCSAAGVDHLVWLDAEHVVSGARRSPHLRPLQQIRIDEHPQTGCMTERWHADVVEFNPTDPAAIRDRAVNADLSVDSPQSWKR